MDKDAQLALFRGGWIALGLLVTGWLLMMGVAPLYAHHGGTILAEEDAGPYQITVMASADPLQTGTNEISVRVGRTSDSAIVLDAYVTVIAESADRSSQKEVALSHANAENKLYYAGDVAFPKPGPWQLTVRVDGPDGSVTMSFDARVEPQPKEALLLRYADLLSLSVGTFVLLVFLWRRRGRK